MVTRKRRPRLVSFVATLLLAQLVLVAGHLHLTGLRGDAIAAVADSTGHNSGDPHDTGAPCPVCWVHAAANMLLMPPAVPVLLPAQIFAARLSPALTGHAARLAATAFDPRAPPAA
ncbi:MULTISPECIES: DUF2946 family protein [Rhodomicrobium]|uniref:DUF2946 family protein n=1 Tax=Rhodomicrobium TaxID=1068 RepID=UPI000B4B4FF6|nr:MULTISPECIES: DUF2946 family protein [Rhodomicrobium]